ncbi:hypothetical protein LEN26_011871 [Aphanomyces euteiches]|nr:hypothetical protein LEN26_011871 [Aphanomyces euteiches]
MAQSDTRTGRLVNRKSYYREMDKMYREERKLVKTYYVNKAQELEEILRALQAKRQGTALPWKVVAEAMKDGLDSAERERQDLRHKLLMSLSKIQHVYFRHSIDDNVSTWRDTTLTVNPDARRLGMEWISKKMFHNVDRIFHQYGFPPRESSDPFTTIDMNLYEDRRYEVVMAVQSTLEMPPTDAFVSLCCDRILTFMLIFFASEISKNTIKEAHDGKYFLHQMLTSMGNFDVFMNVMTTAFREKDRYLVVAQNIQEDETVKSSGPRTHRTFWMDMNRLANGSWNCRVLQVLSTEGSCSWEDKAKHWGFSLADAPNASHQALFKRRLIQKCQIMAAHISTFLRRLQRQADAKQV